MIPQRDSAWNNSIFLNLRNVVKNNLDMKCAHAGVPAAAHGVNKISFIRAKVHKK